MANKLLSVLDLETNQIVLVGYEYWKINQSKYKTIEPTPSPEPIVTIDTTSPVIIKKRRKEKI